jgi:hypothetical protein
LRHSNHVINPYELEKRQLGRGQLLEVDVVLQRPFSVLAQYVHSRNCWPESTHGTGVASWPFERALVDVHDEINVA